MHGDFLGQNCANCATSSIYFIGERAKCDSKSASSRRKTNDGQLNWSRCLH